VELEQAPEVGRERRRLLLLSESVLS
jgi:hypothetical protein